MTEHQREMLESGARTLGTALIVGPTLGVRVPLFAAAMLVGTLGTLHTVRRCRQHALEEEYKQLIQPSE